MFSFSIRNTKISIDIGFLAVISVIMLSGGKFYGCSFFACIIHELGHLLQMFIVNDTAESVSFNVTGIKLVPSGSRLRSVYSDMSVLLAGPAANFTVAFLLSAANEGRHNVFTVINLMIGIFNLLPFECLDGGSVVRCATEYFIKHDRLRGVMTAVHTLNIFIVFILVGILFKAAVFNVSAVIMGAYIIFTELIALKKLV